MILVVGSRASGKRTFVQGLGFGPDDLADGVVDARPVLLNLQDVVAKRLAGAETAQGFDAEGLAAELAAKQVVCCCEVGSGIVPADAAERAWREAVGRTTTALAARAERVVRLVCGIPVDLK